MWHRTCLVSCPNPTQLVARRRGLVSQVQMLGLAEYIYKPCNRGHALMFSHHSNRCYAAIMIGNIDDNKRIKLPVLATILQVPFLSCTGMLSVMTSSLYTIALKLNACSIPRSGRPHRTFSLFIGSQNGDATCTSSIVSVRLQIGQCE